MLKPSPSPASFDLFPLRFRFLARDRFEFPALLSSNIFRGAFGLTLRALDPELYAKLFAPIDAMKPVSGLHHPPRPFVFRTRHLDGASVLPGVGFEIGFPLFISEDPPIDALIDAFDALARTGFGPQRSRAQLITESEPAKRLSLPITTGIAAAECDVERIRVDFLTPTELKESGELAAAPGFGTLFRRSRERIDNLRTLYGSGPPESDLKGMSAAAHNIRLTDSEIRYVKVTRRSSHTGQVHPLGGFTGWAEYRGRLAAFLPYLEVVQWTGVGRQTVWGKGEIAVTRVS